MFNQSRLPDALEQDTIERMLPGASAYTVPWAMYADHEGLLWINGNYTIHSSTGGTVQMRITRTEEGVIVHKNTIPKDTKFSKGPPGFVGNFTPLPVHLQGFGFKW